MTQINRECMLKLMKHRIDSNVVSLQGVAGTNPYSLVLLNKKGLKCVNGLTKVKTLIVKFKVTGLVKGLLQFKLYCEKT